MASTQVRRAAGNRHPDWLERLRIEQMMERFVPPPVRNQRPDHSWWRHDPTARRALMTAHLAGIAAGALRAVPEAGEDIAQTGRFVSRLFNPWDRERSLPGQSARDQLVSATRAAAGYIADRSRHPRHALKDVASAVREAHASLNPYASPRPTSFAKAITRRARTGVNLGKLGVNVGLTVATDGVLRATAPAPRISSARMFEIMGYSPEDVADLNSLYVRFGHHSPIPVRTESPSVLGDFNVPLEYAGLRYPRPLLDNPFNQVRPAGITKGDMYALHYQLDPDFKGTQLKSGTSWSGEGLGLRKFGLFDPQRYWYGTPDPLKAAIGAGLAGAAAAELAQSQSSERPSR